VSEPRRTGFSSQVSPATQARVRATVRGMARETGADVSLAQLVEDALDAWCAHLEEQYNGGQRWPTSGRRLRPGARLGPEGSDSDGITSPPGQ
jgi:Centromere-binding protein ParB C-terminal